MIVMLNVAAITAFLAGGFAMLLGNRPASGKLILVAVFLAVAAGFAPRGLG